MVVTQAAWVEGNSGVLVWRKSAATSRLFVGWLKAYCALARDPSNFNGGDQHVLSAEVLTAVRRDGPRGNVAAPSRCTVFGRGVAPGVFLRH